MKSNKSIKKRHRAAGFLFVMILCMILVLTGCNRNEEAYVLAPTGMGAQNNTESTDNLVLDSSEATTHMNNNDNVATEDEQLSVDPDDTMIKIHTPYITMEYPMAWKEYVRFDVTEDCVSFVGVFSGKPEVKLFDVLFGDDAGTCLGYLENDGNLVPVSILPYEMLTDESWGQGDLNVLSAMMEDMNLIIDQISRSVRDVEGEYFYIPAPYDTELRYPVLWKDDLEVRTSDSEEHALHFMAVLNEDTEVPLFDLYFGPEMGACIGYLIRESGMVPIYLLTHDIQVFDELSDQDISQLYGMQEGINVIIEGLAETGSFRYPDV